MSRTAWHPLPTGEGQGGASVQRSPAEGHPLTAHRSSAQRPKANRSPLKALTAKGEAFPSPFTFHP